MVYLDLIRSDLALSGPLSRANARGGQAGELCSSVWDMPTPALLLLGISHRGTRDGEAWLMSSMTGESAGLVAVAGEMFAAQSRASATACA